MAGNLALRNKQLDDYGTAMTGATLTLYGGTVPASADAALSGNTAAASHTVAGFNAASNGIKTAQAIADATISNSVNPVTFARLVNGSYVEQLPVGLSGSGAPVIVSSLDYVAGGNSQIISLTLSKS